MPRRQRRFGVLHYITGDHPTLLYGGEPSSSRLLTPHYDPYL
ncbi:hypothetical protein A2U01_0097935, partial [Trifolium medium]|nr:hypothetical protein [Trifolium medium]